MNDLPEFTLKNQEFLQIAMKQCAKDLGCHVDDFLSSKNVIVPLCQKKNVRDCLKATSGCNFVSFGNNIVISASEDISDIISEYLKRYEDEFCYCFDTPNIHWLNERLVSSGYKICFMSEYYLPDVKKLPNLSCTYEVRMLKQDKLKGLYSHEWRHALSCDYTQDVLGFGAYDKGKLVGLAACSDDCKDMWQMGVDVLPDYRKCGIGSALTVLLAKEILKQGKVPFYCVAWSNIRSTRNAVKSGFLPSWAEMTVRPTKMVDEMSEKDISK